VFPEVTEKTQTSGTYTVGCEDIQCTFPVDTVKGLLQIQEDHVVRLLLCNRELLDKLGFNEGGSSSSPWQAAMKGRVEVNGLNEAGIDNALHHFPYNLQQANASEIATPFRKEYDGGPCQSTWERSCLET
jgi:hypothetical protein